MSNEVRTVKDEIIDLILLGNTEVAKIKLGLLDKGVLDEKGNTLYHVAVERQDLKLLR